MALSILALSLGSIGCLLTAWAYATPNQHSLANSSYAEVTAAYSYQATVVPDTLYPQGGTTPVNATIFPNITNTLAVNFHAFAISTRGSTLSMKISPIIRIVAPGLWERDFPLGAGQKVAGPIPKVQLPNATWQLNVPSIASQIAGVQKAIQAVPNAYTVVVDPELHGTIRQGTVTKPIHWDPRLRFTLSSGTWKVQGRLAQVHVVRFMRSTLVPNFLTLAGMRMRPAAARGAFAIAAVLFLVLGFALRLTGRGKRAPTAEWQRMEQKYRGRIVRTSLEVGALRRETLRVESFQTLARLGEEKELPILRTESPDAVEYIVVDGDLAYVVSYPQAESAATQSAPSLTQEA